MPGIPGWALQRRPDATFCGGIKIVTVRRKRRLQPEELPLSKVFGLAFPTGLDFSPGKAAAKDASMKRFNAFVADLQKVGGEARDFYLKELGAAGDTDTKLRDTARLAQIDLRLASVLARAEIPKDVRTGEFAADKIAAFCDKLDEIRRAAAGPGRGRDSSGARSRWPPPRPPGGGRRCALRQLRLQPHLLDQVICAVERVHRPDHVARVDVDRARASRR